MAKLIKLTDPLREFLDQPNVAILATVRKDGSPHLTRVWYEYDGEEVRISITDTRAKYRHVLRDPRVSLAVTTPNASNQDVHKEVILEGKAQVTSEGGPELIRSLGIKFEGAEEGNKYADLSLNELKDNRLVLHFKPERIMAWDFTVEDDDHRPIQPTNPS